MGLALVVVKEHAGGTVQLGHDNPLGTVDDEGTVIGHEGDFPHIDFLFLDILDGLVGRFLVVDHQTHAHPKRDGEGHAAKLTVFFVE